MAFYASSPPSIIYIHISSIHHPYIIIHTSSILHFYTSVHHPHSIHISFTYGVATISRMLKNIGLFCKRDLQKRPIFCKETYIFKHPTHRSHPISFMYRPYIIHISSIHYPYIISLFILIHAYTSIYIHIHPYTSIYIHIHPYTSIHHPQIIHISFIHHPLNYRSLLQKSPIKEMREHLYIIRTSSMHHPYTSEHHPHFVYISSINHPYIILIHPYTSIHHPYIIHIHPYTSIYIHIHPYTSIYIHIHS